MASTNPFREMADMSLVECPYCGATGPAPGPGGPQMMCSGSFTERDHPSNVLMVLAVLVDSTPSQPSRDAGGREMTPRDPHFTECVRDIGAAVRALDEGEEGPS